MTFIFQKKRSYVWKFWYQNQKMSKIRDKHFMGIQFYTYRRFLYVSYFKSVWTLETLENLVLARMPNKYKRHFLTFLVEPFN